MVKRVLILALTALLLSSCTKPLNEGTVIDRNFEPSHYETRTVAETYHVPEYKCSMQSRTRYVNGKSESYSENVCGTQMVAHTRWVPRTFHVDDEWSILIKSCKQDDSGKEKCRKEWKAVRQSVYNKATDGSYFKDGEITNNL